MTSQPSYLGQGSTSPVLDVFRGAKRGILPVLAFDSSVGTEACALIDQAQSRLPEGPESPPDCKDFMLVRPLCRGDLYALSGDLGKTVDVLYPNGRAVMLDRLENSLHAGTGAIVAASMASPWVPIALASETTKGHRRAKLCTFWVSSTWRRRGVGRLLLEHRVADWVRTDMESLHVTVRCGHEVGLQRLMEPYGFRQVAVDLSRYGDGEDEVVLQWKPEWLAQNSEEESRCLALNNQQDRSLA